MYVGFTTGWIGLWIVFGHANPVATGIVAAVATGVHLFVVLYDGPILQKAFGTEYEEYRRNRRWWARACGGQGVTHRIPLQIA
jgi:protein-S-isoprenylcysteine O-methyltransferase Ste14